MKTGINARRLADWMKECAKSCYDDDSDGVYSYLAPGGKYAFAIGWESGYDPNHEGVYHSRKYPECVVSMKIGLYNPYDFCEYEFIDMPCDERSGEVWDTSHSLGPMSEEVYLRLAQWYVTELRDMIKEYGNE